MRRRHTRSRVTAIRYGLAASTRVRGRVSTTHVETKRLVLYYWEQSDQPRVLNRARVHHRLICA